MFWQKHAQQETRRAGYHHDIADELAVSRGLSWRKYHLSDCLQWIAAGENKRGPLAPPTGGGHRKAQVLGGKTPDTYPGHDKS